jgi:phosphoserine phosphatase
VVTASLRYATVVLDVDSTLSAIEGIDWLAAQRDVTVAREIAALTDAAMEGAVALDAVYGARLARIAPTRDELSALADAYIAAIAPDARAVIARGYAHGLRWVIVSGGIREAILPLAAHVGIAAADVHAVSVQTDARGDYVGFDERSPLTRRGGKPQLLRSIVASLDAPIVAVGDGSTDAELAAEVAAFWAFTGFARRPTVVAAAAAEMASFAALGDALGV